MEIRILGSVELRVPGEKSFVIPESGRRLLAALAWQPNQFISDETVVEHVWGEEPPQHPRDALYTCASRLRRSFGECQGDSRSRLIRRRGGYVLAIDPHHIDLHRSRLLIGRARRASRAGDHPSALALFDRALDLWAAVPLSDLGSSWAAAVRLALEQERLSALVDRLRTDLLLGHHVESVPLLHRLVTEHPFDEVLTEMLMTALYRSGRQNESLKSFERIRWHLLEELGDDPGILLRELHGRILRRDPSLIQPADPIAADAAGAHEFRNREKSTTEERNWMMETIEENENKKPEPAAEDLIEIRLLDKIETVQLKHQGR